MIRKLLLPVLAAGLLAGCVTDYTYRGGGGDYYYGRPSVEYRYYGAPYGGYYGGYYGGFYGGYGGYYGYPYRYSGPYRYGYHGYPYHYGYPNYRPHRPYRPYTPPPRPGVYPMPRPDIGTRPGNGQWQGPRPNRPPQGSVGQDRPRPPHAEARPEPRPQPTPRRMNSDHVQRQER